MRLKKRKLVCQNQQLGTFRSRRAKEDDKMANDLVDREAQEDSPQDEKLHQQNDQVTVHNSTHKNKLVEFLSTDQIKIKTVERGK